MTTRLAEKTCKACEGGTPRLSPERSRELSRQLSRGWRLNAEQQLEREFKFANFRDALVFTNKVGDLAEQEGHHPDVYLAWGKVKLTLSTHSAGGLTENDFILAAKIDELGQP